MDQKWQVPYLGSRNEKVRKMIPSIEECYRLHGPKMGPLNLDFSHPYQLIEAHFQALVMLLRDEVRHDHKELRL